MPSDGIAIATLVRQAVQCLRALSADPNAGHGRDLMPGRDDEYLLHNVDGGVVEDMKDLVWESVGGQQRVELVLTWRLPSVHLAGQAGVGQA